ncbi:hypothetical protein ACFL3D_06865, partial [Candidatus Omnitrophota bacterium]
SGDNGFCLRNASGAVMIDTEKLIKEKFIKYWNERFNMTIEESEINIDKIDEPYPDILKHTIFENPLINKILIHQSELRQRGIYIEPSDVSVLYDSMSGVGAYVSYLIYEHEKFNFLFKQIDKEGNLVEDNAHFNPVIDKSDRKPYPNFERVADWMKYMELYDSDFVISNDGDGDRHAFADVGGFIDWNELFLLLLDYCGEIGYLENYTHIVATYTTTGILESIAQRYGLEIKWVDVGFKNISKAIEDIETNDEQKVFAGFEGNGGLVLHFDKFVVDKDGIVANLVLSLIKAESMARGRKSLREDISEVYEKHGIQKQSGFMQEIIVPATNGVFRNYREKWLAIEDTFLGRAIDKERSCFIDSGEKGRKLVFEDGSWVIMRASGTESSKARFYVEASSAKVRNALIVDLLEDYYSNFSESERIHHGTDITNFFKQHLYQNFPKAAVDAALKTFAHGGEGEFRRIYGYLSSATDSFFMLESKYYEFA